MQCEKIKNYRKGNAELRVGRTIAFKDHPSKAYGEVVLWYPNGYYGKLKEFEEVDGRPDMYRKKNGEPWETNCYIHKSCFKNPESCYTVVTFDDTDDDCPDFKSVGDRLVSLAPRDLADTIDCIKEFYRQLKEINSDNSDEW